MRSTSAARAESPRWARVRQLLSHQVRLWDRMLDDLEPWHQDGPLRWRGTRLDGAVLTDAGPRSGR